MKRPVIICVDDEPMVLESLKVELKKAVGDQCLIETAEGGEDALVLFEELQEDDYEVALILSDHIMPDIKGDELLKRIHNMAPATLKIMLTGQADLEAVGNAIKHARLYRYIAKPWDTDDLRLTVIEAVHSYLQEKKLCEQSKLLKLKNAELAGLNARLEDMVAERTAELVEANASLRASNIELDAFARTVAHDLKSPLSVLQGYADYLIQSFADGPDPEPHDLLTRMLKVSHKMGSIIDELLLLASIRKEDIQKKPLDMNLVLNRTLERLSAMIDNYQATIITPDTWPQALGYAPWVEEVWINYLSNGIKYGGEPPVLELGAGPHSDGMLRFWVKDNGTGLTPDDQQILFTEFARLNEVRAKGHGLGLSIVLRIVSKLGGQVGVESQVGEGSTFYFTLPEATIVDQSFSNF